jgi:hypothetical protein
VFLNFFRKRIPQAITEDDLFILAAGYKVRKITNFFSWHDGLRLLYLVGISGTDLSFWESSLKLPQGLVT